MGVVVGRAWTGSNHARAHRRRGWTVTRGRGWNGWVTAAVKGDGAQFFDRCDVLFYRCDVFIDLVGKRRNGDDRKLATATTE
ncbi:hypothetical protein QVD17_35235 [Tagetes erecta]|uniref:Uncharacterized protein n=1 Tax=Tagetes erecta TaxID=13708 RepID=A0AAD8NLR5_TARER|nr:hypothetical protein QVD17_35235 [Tagetes erecta]